jgi:hypothetical protein
VSKLAPRRRQALSAAEGATVDARAALTVAKATARSQSVVGFGCPAVDWPHYLRVVIPAARGEHVVLIEDFGILGHSAGRPDEIERCAVDRARWNLIAEPVKREFNERLKALSLPASRWQSGDNKVERMLGQELLALAWPVAEADEADLPAILASWQALRPEERWWLAGRVAANPTARVARGLAMLLSGGPAQGDASHRRIGSAARQTAPLPLFDLPKTAA